MSTAYAATLLVPGAATVLAGCEDGTPAHAEKEPSPLPLDGRSVSTGTEPSAYAADGSSAVLAMALAARGDTMYAALVAGG